MSITFTDERYLTTSANQVLWDNQTQASLSFFFRYETIGDSSGDEVNLCMVAGRSGYVGFDSVMTYGGNNTDNNVAVVFQIRDGAQVISTIYLFTKGLPYHVAITHSQGAQTLWVNGVPTVFGTASITTESADLTFQIGGTPKNQGTGPCVYTLSDVAIWNGYVLTSTDILNLCYGNQIPSQIGESAALRTEWTLAGTIGNTPLVGDAGLINTFGNATYNLTTIGGAGSAVYSESITIQPTADIQTAYVGTSGKTVVIFFKNIATSQLSLPVNQVMAPTVYKNNTNLGQLTNLWLTGYHNCIVYSLPTGTSVVPTDTITLTAPNSWMVTAAGSTQSLSGVPIGNMTGKSAFGTDTLVKTLKMGMNFPHLGTHRSSLYQVPKNWRYRLDPFFGSTNSLDGVPISWIPDWDSVAAYIYTPYSGNGIDSTGFPSLPGLYAICWDDLNLSTPTTFSLSTDDPSSTTITKRTDLDNPGDTNGIGKVRVFNVQRSVGSTVAYLNFQLRVYNTNKTPHFANLFIYGPGDFYYDPTSTIENPIPVTLDRSDPYALSTIFKDRLHNSMGSARWMDSTINYGCITNLSEPEELRLLEDFTWGDGNHKIYRTIGYTSLRPYSTSVSPYIYSTFFGSPYTATLASGITTAPIAGTQETYGPGYFIDAIAAPILAGLTLTIDSEIIRVLDVSGTDPSGTVIVARGAANTTPALHGSGLIQVNNRLAVTGLSMLGDSTSLIVEHVTRDPHKVKTGNFVKFSGTFPTPLFTDDTQLGQLNDYSRVVFVTGPNTFVTSWQNGTTGGPVTLAGTTSCDPDQCITIWSLSDVGFPYEFVSLATGKLPGCDLHINIPVMASDTLIDKIAQLVRDNFPVGRNVWVELSDEPWNNGFLQYNTFNFMTNFGFPGETFYTWNVVRTGQICQRMRDRFNDGGRNRGDEIKCLINIQSVSPDMTQTVLNLGVTKNVTIDGIASALYVNTDGSAASIGAYNAADNEQAMDLWIHDLYTNASVSYPTTGWTYYMQQHTAYISDYNNNYGKTCVLYGYEGGTSDTTPGNYIGERSRDMTYNPNWYIIEKDMYAFFQKYFARFNLYAYDMVYVGVDNWAVYHSIAQPYGLGDGSDGKADNRLCLATPGKPYTKSSMTNQDQQNVSVRGLAFLDWMEDFTRNFNFSASSDFYITLTASTIVINGLFSFSESSDFSVNLNKISYNYLSAVLLGMM